MGESKITRLTAAEVHQREKHIAICVNRCKDHLDSHIAHEYRLSSIINICEHEPGSIIVVEQGEDIVAIMACIEKPFRDDDKRLFIAGLDYSDSNDAFTLLNYAEQTAKVRNLRKIYIECGTFIDAEQMLARWGYFAERVWIRKNVDDVVSYVPNRDVRICQLNSTMIQKHFDELSDLYLINEHSHIYCESVKKEEADEEINNLQGFLDKGKAYAYGALSDNNRIVGLAWAFPFALECNQRVNLRSITINPDYRGRSIAKSLMNAVYIRVKDEGYSCMYTHYDKTNASAEGFYVKEGWNPIGVQMVKHIVP